MVQVAEFLSLLYTWVVLLDHWSVRICVLIVTYYVNKVSFNVYTKCIKIHLVGPNIFANAIFI